MRFPHACQTRFMPCRLRSTSFCLYAHKSSLLVLHEHPSLRFLFLSQAPYHESSTDTSLAYDALPPQRSNLLSALRYCLDIHSNLYSTSPSCIPSNPFNPCIKNFPGVGGGHPSPARWVLHPPSLTRPGLDALVSFNSLTAGSAILCFLLCVLTKLHYI
jgi:hypothetical protein